MEGATAGSDTRGSNGGSGSSDSLDGLKFGKKIYFEDVGASQPPATASAASAAGTKKGRPPAVQQQQQQQVPRCQVEGCGEDLSGEKSYYCRHKVCAAHSKSPKVVVGGLEQRFCQQCSRFHELPEFDQGKRSCRRRLAGHNERRRKPPPGSLSLRYEQQLSSCFHENGGRVGGFVMDFTRPTLPATAKDLWPDVRSSVQATAHGQWPAAPDRPSSSSTVMAAQVVQHYGQEPTSGTLFSEPEILPADCIGFSDSNRALSLLSSKPWGTTGVSSLPPFRSATVTQQPAAATFTEDPWGLNRNEGSSSSSNRMHEVPHGVAVGLGQVIEPQGGGHFADEQHLALQGDRQFMERGQAGTYDPSSSMMHWPL